MNLKHWFKPIVPVESRLRVAPRNVSECVLHEMIDIIIIIIIIKKRAAVQGWERVIYTLSVRRPPQPHNTNL